MREDTDELLVDFKVTKDLIPVQVFLMSLDEFAKNVSKYCLLHLLISKTIEFLIILYFSLNFFSYPGFMFKGNFSLREFFKRSMLV